MKGKKAKSQLKEEVRRFLESLNRDVSDGKSGRLIASSRTALAQDEIEFRVLDSDKQKPLQRAVNILGPGVSRPDVEKVPRAYTFPEFLDFTVNAEGIAKALVADPRIQEHNDAYIPQNVERNGHQLNLDAREFFFQEWLGNDEQQLLAILAPAGYGKTVLTSAITHNLAENYLESPGFHPFPFLVNFGDFRRLASFDGMILEALQANGVSDYTSTAFSYLAQRGRVVIILDGFDELLEERPGEAQQNLAELVETLGGRGKILITARDAFFRTSDDVAKFLSYDVDPDEVSVLDLQPFDASQRAQFIQQAARNQSDVNRLTDFTGNDQILEVMGSPLLLKEVVTSLMNAASTDSASRRRMNSRVKLFEMLEESVYERERERQSHTVNSRDQRAFLESLAKELLEANERGFDRSLIEVAASEVDEDEATKLAKHHFLHVPDGAVDVRFNHQVFREYFQARSIVEACANGDVAWVVNVLRDRPLPEEVGIFLAELDSRRENISRLLDAVPSETANSVLIDNVGLLCSAYADRGLIGRFVAGVPTHAQCSLRLRHIDLSGLDWSNRSFSSLVFENCSLDSLNLRTSKIVELTISNSSLGGAIFDETAIGSLSLDFGERRFGAAEIASSLLAAGCARAGDESNLTKVGEIQFDKNLCLLRERLKRFYLPGDTKVSSRWNSSIQEKNLLGGVDPQDKYFVKRKLIPAMQSGGLLDRRRDYNLVLFELRDDAEDDARVLLEEDVQRGAVVATLERLSR